MSALFLMYRRLVWNY